MTMVSGYATSFLQLAAARAGLGIGEAATAPAAQSMLSDLYSGNRRTGVLSMLAIAGPIGVMLAFIVGGRLQASMGWRMTLVAIGAPGFLLALLVLVTVREPARGAAEKVWIDSGQQNLRETLSYLWSLRSLRCITAGASFNLFCAWGMTVWSVPFLVRVHGMDAPAASAFVGLGSGAGGIAGTLAGGFIAESLSSRRNAKWQLRVPAVSSGLAAVFVALFLVLPSPVWVAYFAASFLGSSMIGPVLSVTQNLAKVRMRALAAALVAMTFNVIGTGCGPLTVGILSDVLAPRFGAASLRYALMLPVTAMLTAAWCFRLGERYVVTEMEGARLFETVPAHADVELMPR
jgi:MFS family permease